MKQLVREAASITKDLGQVVFIGAIARYFHTKDYRESQDIDFMMIPPLVEEELNKKGYNKFTENRKEVWRTPNGIKIDIFTSDVGRIPFDTIINTAKQFDADKKGNKLSVMSLECLINSKHRAQREQDIDDLRMIAHRKLGEIDWDELKRIVNNDTEYKSIKTSMEFQAKSEY